MRILYVSDRSEGGIRKHVQCIRSCLPPDVESYAIGEDEPFAGKSGHDLREWFQIRRVIRAFNPDVVHFHTIPLLMALYVRFVARLPRVCSIHTPSNPNVDFDRHILNLAVQPCYFLPVSGVNWRQFRSRYPTAQGEVFVNPVNIGLEIRVDSGGLKSNISSNSSPVSNNPTIQQPNNSHSILGMVGRNAAVKDWPAFHTVADLVGQHRRLEVWNLGENEFCSNAAEKIAAMDLFVLTSISEEMPTTVLECFRARTPICGFIPKGGMEDILALSNGALREVFIAERDVNELAAIARRVLDDAELRERIVEDGWQILVNHFDAMKNVRGRLMEVYEELAREGLGVRG